MGCLNCTISSQIKTGSVAIIPTCRRTFWSRRTSCWGHLVTGAGRPRPPFTGGWGWLYFRYNCIARGRSQSTLIVCKWMHGQQNTHKNTMVVDATFRYNWQLEYLFLTILPTNNLILGTLGTDLLMTWNSSS